MIGTILKNRYKLVSKLGVGVSSTVYEAEDLQAGQKLAIKVLKPELNHNPTFVQRFRRETRTAQSLNSPYVVKVFEWDIQEDNNYIVMELVKGKTLRQMLDEQGHLPIIQSLRIIIQVLEGIGEAHKAGIVHRDLKPANIMVTPEGLTKVMDFGIAKDAALTSLTSDGSVIGTPYYMSPEQVRGLHVDGRADIYAVGAILYEMLSGHPPFDADTAYGIITKHIEAQPVPLHLINPNIPMLLNAMVLKALAKKPEDRYQNSSEMVYALRLYPGVTGEASMTTDGPTVPLPAMYAPFPNTPTPSGSQNLSPTTPAPAVQFGPRSENAPFKQAVPPGVQSPMMPAPQQPGPLPYQPPGGMSPVPPPYQPPVPPGGQSQMPPANLPPRIPGTQPSASGSVPPGIMPPPHGSVPPGVMPPRPGPISSIPGQPLPVPPNQMPPRPGTQSPIPPYVPAQGSGSQSTAPAYAPPLPKPAKPVRRGNALIWILPLLALVIIAAVVVLVLILGNNGSKVADNTAVPVPTNTIPVTTLTTAEVPTSVTVETTVALSITPEPSPTLAPFTTSIALNTVAPTPTIDQNENAFNDALAAVNQQDWKKAIPLLEALAARNFKPDEVKQQLTIAYCTYGRTLAPSGDPSEAFVYLDNCIKLDANNADAKAAFNRISLYREGTIFATQKNWPAALPPLENLYALEAGFRDTGAILFDAYRQYLNFLTDNRRYSEGLGVCNKAKAMTVGANYNLMDPDCKRVQQLLFTPTPLPRPATPTPTPRSCYSNFFAYNVGQPPVPNVTDQGSSVVQGLVINRSKVAIAGATVRVSSGGFSFTTSTNGSGRYSIGGLGRGQWYVVVVAAPGYSICTSLSAAVNLSGAANFVVTADFVESEP